MSLSSIPCHPRILDPSNPMPSSNVSCSNLSTGIVKCCQTPGKSVNFKSTALTSFSRHNARTSLGVTSLPFRVEEHENQKEFIQLHRPGLPSGAFSSWLDWRRENPISRQGYDPSPDSCRGSLPSTHRCTFQVQYQRHCVPEKTWFIELKRQKSMGCADFLASGK